MNVSEWKFCLGLPDEFASKRDEAKAKIMEHIKAHSKFMILN